VCQFSRYRSNCRIRGEFLNSEKRFEKIVVHGHNPVMDVEFHSNRINVNTGAFVTGRLSCLRIESDEALFNVHCFEGPHVGHTDSTSSLAASGAISISHDLAVTPSFIWRTIRVLYGAPVAPFRIPRSQAGEAGTK